jgi:hypothetical protein
MIIAYPFELLWLARLALGTVAADARRGRTVLAALVAIQLSITIGFLGYIHAHEGAPGQEYGITYGARMRALAQHQ